MGKKDKKDPAKAEAKKARQNAKQQKATVKRSKKEAKELGEDDIDTILAEFAKKDADRVAVTVSVCVEPPSPRSNFSMSTLPNGDFIMFGGEFCDGEKVSVFNDVLVWNIERNEWKQIESPNTPPPRCAHQSVVFKDKLYVFGGEYATLDQFHHYKDMWALDLKTYMWTQVTPLGNEHPSARSGHRMVVWRNYIVLFGGFYEAMRDVRWFNDLYIYSIAENRWFLAPPKLHSPVPKPRSGFQMCVYNAEDTLYIYGGFSKEKQVAAIGSATSTKSKKESKVHEDMWSLSLKALVQSGANASASSSDVASDVQPAIVSKYAPKPQKGKGNTSGSSSSDKCAGKYQAQWLKVSKKGQYPSSRCGAALVAYKNKGLLFGGVYDEEGQGHSMTSTFFADTYAFDMERKRWFQLGLKNTAAIAAANAAKKIARQLAKLSKQNPASAVGGEEGDESGSDSEIEAGEDAEEEDIEGVNENTFGYIDDNGDIIYVALDEEDEDVQVENSHTNSNAHGGSGSCAGTLQGNGAIDAVGTVVADITDLTLSDVDLKCVDIEDNLPDVANSNLMSDGSSKASKSDRPDPKGESAPEPTIQTDQMQVGMSNVARYFSNRISPCPRINPCMAIKGHTLYIYGGITELGDTEVTLDDCWCLDLNKRDKWKQVLPGTMHTLVWKGDEDDGTSTLGGDSDDEDSDEEDEDSDEDSDSEVDVQPEEGMEEASGAKSKSSKLKDKNRSRDDGGITSTATTDLLMGDTLTKTSKKSKSSSSGGGSRKSASSGGALSASVRAEIQELRESLGADDENTMPENGESLRSFYSRTIVYWSDMAVKEVTQRLGLNETADRDAVLTEKQIKREGFKLAEIRYGEVLPTLTRINELEEQQDCEEVEAGDHKSEKKSKKSKSEKKDKKDKKK